MLRMTNVREPSPLDKRDEIVYICVVNLKMRFFNACKPQEVKKEMYIETKEDKHL